MTYTAPLLVTLLAAQEKKRDRSDLFRSDTFTLPYRAKVGSSPHPNLETLVSAGEPYGRWQQTDREDFGQLGERRQKLPLRGYIPASAIRGIVRSWVEKHQPTSRDRMERLLGKQTAKQEITPGIVEFFDAWPAKATQLAIDVVNPQQEFQVFHSTTQQSNPQPLYTFGDGRKDLEVTIALRGIPGKATKADIDTLWQWLQSALAELGVGSRTAAGYGRVLAPPTPGQTQTPWFATSSHAVQVFDFQLYSQGCYGIKPPSKQNGWEGYPELRTTHWRGWLRSWLLRFLLGVMDRPNAEKTLFELMGTIEPEAIQGCVRLEVQGLQSYQKALSSPAFYCWEGKLILSAPPDILQKVVLPVVRFAASVGGVGRGWRRPLHIFTDPKGNKRTRGSHLLFDRAIRKTIIQLQPQDWQKLYADWKSAVIAKWGDRIAPRPTNHNAEVVSPTACAVYAVPGPKQEPINFGNLGWQDSTKPLEMRGQGVNLIYDTKYKGDPVIGGAAAQKKDAQGKKESHCSWASIRRTKVSGKPTECMEIVCLFWGNPSNDPEGKRSQFLGDLSNISGATHLFGVQP